MGRGGFVDNLLESGVNTLRSICACICCIFIAGPVLLIVGIVMLVAPNTRVDDINAYNKVVTAWTTLSTTINGLEAVDVAPTNAPKSFTSLGKVIVAPVPVKGNLDGVDMASKSVYWMTPTATIGSTSSTYTVHIDDLKFTTPSIALTKYETQTAYCKCTSSSTCKCTSSSGISCPSGMTWLKPTMTSCTKGSACGTCEGTTYLSSVCVVVDLTNKTVAMSSKYGSCKYPFSASNIATYSSSKSTTMTFTVRDSNDPYMALQRITSGSDDFGMTASQQRKVGLALLAVGAVISFFIFGGIGYMVCGRREQTTALYQRTRGNPSPYYNQTNMNAMNQPMNVCAPAPYPQQGYPPQAQGYPPQNQGYPPQPQGYPPQPQGYPSQYPQQPPVY